MGGGGGSGSLFRTYKGGTYSQGGFSKKTFYSKESQKPNDSAEEILNRHIQSIRVSSNERLNLNDLKNEISDSLSQEMRDK